MNEMREYRCVIEWDIEAEDPIEAARLMWSSIINSPGPIVNVWTGSARSVDVDLTWPTATTDINGATAEEYRHSNNVASEAMTPDGRWTTAPTNNTRTHPDHTASS
ncbi:hypothetical protein HFP15_31130 [Amycolatopsis sp. K13G38]|uniref:Uncharacterized protein n=1 Tax=Amycolatopsis acididurans TaxID=2724524 RepID=A0ABX1JC90_9PSEU|nr:hypothetical protein [Amycolatopsis acididurans]NKQ57329.1 hypothetical protein [Amycolatopsis acididurans]